MSAAAFIIGESLLADDVIDFTEKFPEILEYSEDRLEPYNTVSASSMGYCPRQRVLSKFGGKTTHEDNQAKMFKGSAIHKELQQHEFYDDPEMEGFEVEVAEEFTSDRDGRDTVLKGHIDAVDENSVLYDWKTTSGIQYVEDEPSDHHEAQLQTYLNLADRQFDDLDVDSGELVYIQRWINQNDGEDSMPVVQHTVEKDEDYFEEVLVPRAHGTRMLVEELAKTYEDRGFLYEDELPPEDACWLCNLEELDPDVVS